MNRHTLVIASLAILATGALFFGCTQSEEVGGNDAGTEVDCDLGPAEGCPCIGGEEPVVCGSDEGACGRGTRTCTLSVWGPCIGEVAPSDELCNAIDDDCDGNVPADEVDVDGDGFFVCDGDCDDETVSAHPGGVEICNGVDDDCNGALPASEVDSDLDGFMSCGGDCNDGIAETHPGAPEACDGVDHDCSGILESCACPAEGVVETCGTDTGACIAGSHTCHAGAWSACSGSVEPTAELCNGVDDNCDGAVPANEADADGDGYRVCAGDCNDGSAAIHPGAAEVCDAVDQNCSGSADEGVTGTYWHDADGDGYGNPLQAATGCLSAGWVANSLDCYDANAAAKPGQTAYFPTNRGDGSFDYDCESGSTQRWPAISTCHNYDEANCSAGTGGWVYGFPVPACGISHPSGDTCQYYSGHDEDYCSSMNPNEWTYRTQECH